MKEALIELWKSISEPIKKLIIPLLVGFAIIVLYYYSYQFVTSDKQFQAIAGTVHFKLVVSLVIAGLTIFYIIKWLRVKSNIFKWTLLLSLLSVEIIFFFWSIERPKRDQFTLHFYQYDQENYNLDILKLCASEINSLYPSINFIFHNRQDFFTSNDYVFADSIIKVLQKDRAMLRSKDVAIALTAKNLCGLSMCNLFSLSIPQYSVVSTRDWDYDNYKRISVYQYIINQSLQCLIVSMSSYRNAPISFHGEDETTGCVFDFNNEKSSIRGSIIRPNICESHTIAIKKIFGDQFFADFQSAIAERKWWKNIEQSIKAID